MSKHLFTATLLACAVSMVLMACAGSAPPPAPTSAPAPPVAQPTAAPPAQPTAVPAAKQAAPPTTAPQTAPGDILIGGNFSITGPSSAELQLHRGSANLAVKQINESGGVGGKKLKLMEQDNQSTDAGSVAALKKSVEVDKVIAVLGPTLSTRVMAMDESIRQYAIPMAVGPSLPSATKGNPWFFRFRPDDTLSAYAMASYIKNDLKLSKIGFLVENIAFGTGGADLVEQYSKEMGGASVVKRETYKTGDKDFKPQLLSLKNAGAEIMVAYVSNIADTELMLKQYREIGAPYKFFGSPTALRAAVAFSKEGNESLYLVQDYVPGATPESKKFSDDYRKEYGEDLNTSAAWYYDAVNVLANAIRKGGENKDKIREAILATQGYKGVMGTYNFKPNGDGLSEMTVTQVEKGVQKPLKVVTKPAP